MCVSYLISSYNKSEYLESVLQSVAAELAQTGGEALVLDDGSTDGSWELIQEFCKRDCRITIRKQENRGIFNVTNQLINFASQKWLRLIDCDDPLIIGSTALLIETAETIKRIIYLGKRSRTDLLHFPLRWPSRDKLSRRRSKISPIL